MLQELIGPGNALSARLNFSPTLQYRVPRGRRAGREAVAALSEVAVDIVAAQYEARFRDSMQAHHDLGALPRMAFVPGAGEYVHANCIADGDFALDQHLDAVADRGPRVAKEFDPRRGVDQDYRVRPERISSRSPSQPDPRSAGASSSPRGSAATVRNAKLTASRFVESR